jgi:hypothetical protein
MNRQSKKKETSLFSIPTSFPPTRHGSLSKKPSRASEPNRAFHDCESALTWAGRIGRSWHAQEKEVGRCASMSRSNFNAFSTATGDLRSGPRRRTWAYVLSRSMSKITRFSLGPAHVPFASALRTPSASLRAIYLALPLRVVFLRSSPTIRRDKESRSLFSRGLGPSVRGDRRRRRRRAFNVSFGDPHCVGAWERRDVARRVVRLPEAEVRRAPYSPPKRA